MSPPWITVCVLMYGDYPELADRFLSRLERHTPAVQFELRIGLNAVSRATRKRVDEYCLEHTNASVFASKRNLYKCGMMRRLFHEPHIQTPWTVWFDDDSYPHRGDWLGSLRQHVDAYEDVDCFGKRCHLQPSNAVLDLVATAPWFQGIPWQTDTPTPRNGAANVTFTFALGGFWAIRTRCLYQLDWPDPRLIHFGDDYIFGEALRQNRMRLHDCTAGIAIGDASRRAPPEAPAEL